MTTRMAEILKSLDTGAASKVAMQDICTLGKRKFIHSIIGDN